MRFILLIPLALAFVLTGPSFTSGGPPAPKKALHAVTMDDMKFTPATIEIKVGETVEWTNTDERDHNVTAKDGSFKSDNLSSGSTFKFTFTKAGKFAYGCTLHPRMKGVVVVSEK